MEKKLEKAFENYIKNYDKSKKEIKLKYKHSYEVQKLMEKLGDSLKLSKEEKSLASSIGLLHDIGRFEQIKKYNVCSDIKSNIDHADESCVYLFDKGYIKDFVEENTNYDILKDAIKNHNKLEIDKNVTGKNLYFAKMIRDMDKVDIYRVMCDEYSKQLVFDKDEITDEVLKTFYNHDVIKIKDNKKKTDHILIQLAFVYDINFKESMEILQRTKYLERYLNTIKCKKSSENEFNKVKSELYEYIEKKKEQL